MLVHFEAAEEPVGVTMLYKLIRLASLLLLLTVMHAGSVEAQVSHLPGSRYGFNFDYFTGQDLTPPWSATFDTAAQGKLGWIRFTLYNLQTQTSGQWSWVQQRIKDAQDLGLAVYVSIWWCDPIASCLPTEATVRSYVQVAVQRLTCRHSESIAGCKPVRYFGFTNEPTGFGLDRAAVINQIIRPGFEEAKKVDPAVSVVGPDEDNATALRGYLSDAYQYFDIISFHVYPRGDIQNFRTDLDGFRSTLNDWGKGKLAWLTEFGEERGDDFQNSMYSQMLSEIKARSWIKRAFVFRIRDTQPPGSPNEPPFGILRADNSQKPAFGTLSNFIATQDVPKDRFTIDSSLPGMYFADATGGSDSTAGNWCHEASNCADYLLIANRQTAAVWARITFVRPDGSVRFRDLQLPARSRTNVEIHSEADIAGGGDVSVVVQSLTPSSPVYAEHAVYWNSTDGTTWNGGRATEGVSPSTTWYFAEGVTGTGFQFTEWLTIFNPGAGSVNLTIDFYLTTGTNISKTVVIPDGPGIAKFRVNDIAQEVNTDHGTRVVASSPVVAARTVVWGDDRREGHSSPGAPALSEAWYLAEGHKGFFNTYLLLMNPDEANAAYVQVQYLHENGLFNENLWVAPKARMTVGADGNSQLPNGGFGYAVTSLNGIPIVAERSMYQGGTWNLGTNGVASPVTATRWILPEGATGAFFDSYILLANPNGSDAPVQLRFMLPGGGDLTFNYNVPAYRRISVDVQSLPGLGDTAFSTEVEVTSSVPIVAERAMYWQTFPWYGAHVALGLRY